MAMALFRKSPTRAGENTGPLNKSFLLKGDSRTFDANALRQRGAFSVRLPTNRPPPALYETEPNLETIASADLTVVAKRATGSCERLGCGLARRDQANVVLSTCLSFSFLLFFAGQRASDRSQNLSQFHWIAQ